VGKGEGRDVLVEIVFVPEQGIIERSNTKSLEGEDELQKRGHDLVVCQKHGKLLPGAAERIPRVLGKYEAVPSQTRPVSNLTSTV
jgi:hypothetical protein